MWTTERGGTTSIVPRTAPTPSLPSPCRLSGPTYTSPSSSTLWSPGDLTRVGDSHRSEGRGSGWSEVRDRRLRPRLGRCPQCLTRRLTKQTGRVTKKFSNLSQRLKTFNVSLDLKTKENLFNLDRCVPDVNKGVPSLGDPDYPPGGQ